MAFHIQRQRGVKILLLGPICFSETAVNCWVSTYPLSVQDSLISFGKYLGTKIAPDNLFIHYCVDFLVDGIGSKN